MRKIVVLCLISIFLSACSSDSVNTSEKDSAETAELDTSAEAVSASDTEAKKAAELKRIATESNNALQSLTADLESQAAEWKTKLEATSDQAERQKLLESRPQSKLAEQFVELAKKYPETEAAASAWSLAVQNGSGETKDLATQAVFDATKKIQDETETEKQFVFLMNEGSGPARDAAMEQLLLKAKKDIQSPASFKLLKQIVQTPGGNLPKSNALKELKQFIDADKQSEKAVECLELTYRHGPDAARNLALQDLLDVHVNHDRMIGITADLANNVNQSNEYLIQEIYEKTSGKAKACAMITLSKFYANRAKAKTGITELSEEQLKHLKPEQVEYLKAEHDMGSITTLAGELESFVESHTPLIESAKAELQVLTKLTAEPAPEETKAEEVKVEEPKAEEAKAEPVQKETETIVSVEETPEPAVTSPVILAEEEKNIEVAPIGR